jgi:hypothetical protein
LGLARDIFVSVVSGLVGTLILYGLSLLANILGWKDPLSLLFLKLPFWTVIITILGLGVLVYVVRGRHQGISFASGSYRQRPRYNVSEIMYSSFGVHWRVLYRSLAFNLAPYAFCESKPFCPNCKYEMGSPRKRGILKRFSWKCERCGRTYRCPEDHVLDANDVVERFVESDIRSGRLRPPENPEGLP